jgi:cytoskeletal protein RodZ
MSLEQIGLKLKATREGHSLTLGQVYDRTKIPPNHLEAIETGNADDLPEPVYVAGFIKRYGDMLGLNGQSLADEYKRGGQPAETGRGIFGAGRSAVQQVSAPVVYVAKARTSDAPSFTKTFFYPSLLLVAVIGVVCGLAAWYQSQLVAQQDPGVLALNQSASHFSNLNGGSIPQTTATPATNGLAAVGTGTPGAATTQPAPPQDSKVSLSASQHVWVEVKAVSSGASLFTGYLEMGERRDFQDPQGLRVRAGNGGSLSVAFQGNTETLGAAGKVSEKVYAVPQAPGAASVATNPGTGTATTGAVKPVTTVKKTAWQAKRISDGSGSPSGRHRGLDSSGTRDIPGVSSGSGSRSIDVPYRYNEGRLDND